MRGTRHPNVNNLGRRLLTSGKVLTNGGERILPPKRSVARPLTRQGVAMPEERFLDHLTGVVVGNLRKQGTQYDRPEILSGALEVH
jgi:hypothetical protein